MTKHDEPESMIVSPLAQQPKIISFHLRFPKVAPKMILSPR